LNLNNGKILELEIEPADYVIDCGANIGEIVNLFHFHGANVIAFEPNKHAYEVLLRRFKNINNIKCIPKGVSGKKSAGIRKMFLHEQAEENQVLYSTGSSILEDKQNVNKENFIEVEMVDLCKFLKYFKKKVKVLKIDIEGAEIELLNDLMDENLIRDIPYIFVETHERKIPSLRDTTAALKKRIEQEEYLNINLNWI
jgi:FkbM family methyltransferase